MYESKGSVRLAEGKTRIAWRRIDPADSGCSETGWEVSGRYSGSEGRTNLLVRVLRGRRQAGEQ